MKLVTFISAGAFVLFSAFVMKEQSCNQTSGLYDSKWMLKKIHSTAGTEDVHTRAFLKFDKEKNSAGGNGSCNSFGSTVAVNGNTIQFSQLFSTKMYCEGVQQTEDLYFKLLEQANRFSVKDKKLVLYYNENALLEFVSE